MGRRNLWPGHGFAVAAVGLAARVRHQEGGGPNVVHRTPRPAVDCCGREETGRRRDRASHRRSPCPIPYVPFSSVPAVIGTLHSFWVQGSSGLFCRIFLTADANLTLPEYYPAGCLLGCVDVIDCLPLEEFKAKVGRASIWLSRGVRCSHTARRNRFAVEHVQYPPKEWHSESPYVLVCRNPQRLPLPIPVSGQHKICTQHRAAAQ